MACEGPMRPAEQAPDATVCVIRFDHTVGPVLCWSTLDDIPHASELDTVRAAIESTLPMFVLPEGASSRRSNRPAASAPDDQPNSTPNGRPFRLSIRHESRFVLPVGTTGEVLFGAAVFVLADDSSSASDTPLTSDAARRGASQFSVALLTKAPAMELLLDRLRSVVSVFVRAQYSDSSGSSSSPGGRIDNGVSAEGQAVLRALHQSVVQGGLTADGVPDYGAQVPCAQLVCRRLRESTWPLLQLVLLEGRVLLVSKSAARASAAVWGLASLLPGAIGAGLGHYRSATDAPRFRWTRFGLPLALFSDGHGSGGGGGSGGDGSSAASASGVVADPGTDTSRTHSHNQVSNSSSSNSSRRQRVEYVCLAPLVPMADASRVFGHSSYLAGTANQMVAAMPMAAPDVVFDLDSSVLQRTPQAPHAPPPPPPAITSSDGSGAQASPKDTPAAKSFRLEQQARRVAAVLDGGASGGGYSSATSNNSSNSTNYASATTAGGSMHSNNRSCVVGDSVAASFASLLAVLDGTRGPRDRAHFLACQARAGGASGADGSLFGGWLASAQAAHAATLVAREEGSSSAAAAVAAAGFAQLVHGSSLYGGSSTSIRSAGTGHGQSDSEDELNDDGIDGGSGRGSGNTPRRTTGGWVGSDAWVHGQVQAIFEMLLENTDEALSAHGPSINSNGDSSSSSSSNNTSSSNSNSSTTSTSTSGFGWGGKLLAVAASRGVALPSSLVNALPGGPIAAALAPLAGAEFTALWLQTSHFSRWREGHVTRMATRNRQQALRANHSPVAAGTLWQEGDKDSSRGELTSSGSTSSSSSGVGGLLSNSFLAAGTMRLLNNSGVLGGGGGGPSSDRAEGNTDDATNCFAPPREGDSVAFTFPNGDRYRGGWQQGLRHGEGLVLLARGGKYEGQWQGDLWHGEGVFTSSSEDFIYDGEWQFGHRTGKGHAIWAGRQESYTGEWLRGDFHGRGVHCSGAGDVYDGEFRYGLKCGAGTLVKATAPPSAQARVSSSSSSLSASGNSSRGSHLRSSSGCPPRVWRPDGGVCASISATTLEHHHRINNGGIHSNGTTMSEGSAAAAAPAEASCFATFPVGSSSVALGGDDSSGGGSSGGWWRYTGEWCDGFREGTGTLHLMDGSSYSGQFKFDWPSGEGTWVLRGCGNDASDGRNSGRNSSGNVGGNGGKEEESRSSTKANRSRDDTIRTSSSGESSGAAAAAVGWQVSYEGEWLVGLRQGEGLETMPIAAPSSSSLQLPESGDDGNLAVATAAGVPVRLVPGAVFTREGPFVRGAAVAGDHWRLTWSGLDSASQRAEGGKGEGKGKRGAAAAAVSSMAHNPRHSVPSVFGGYGHADEAGGVGLGASGSVLGSDRTYLGAATPDGLPHGTGTMKWAALGAVYSGEWRRGQRHGQGVCVYRDGSYHKGEWREDRPLDPNLTMEDIDLNTAGTYAWLEPGVTANWALGDDSKPTNQHTALHASRDPTSSSLSSLESSSDNGSLGIESGLLHLLAAPAAAWVGSGSGSGDGSDDSLAPLEQPSRGAGPFTSSNGRMLGRWHERDIGDGNGGGWRLKQGPGLLLRGNWSNLTLIERNAGAAVAEEQPGPPLEVAVVIAVPPAGGAAARDEGVGGAKSTDTAAAAAVADSGQVTGHGEGEDALAGVSYAGAWRFGLPHGKGKLTKHSISAATAASAHMTGATVGVNGTSRSGHSNGGDLSNRGTAPDTLVASSAENGDSHGGAVEWEYEGEFANGRMHGVGTFRWKPINKSPLSATATKGADSNIDVAVGDLLGLAGSEDSTCNSTSTVKAPSPAANAAAAAATAAAESLKAHQSPGKGQFASTSSAEVAARLESLSQVSLQGLVPWDDNYSILRALAADSDNSSIINSHRSSISDGSSNVEGEKEDEAAWATVWRGMAMHLSPGHSSINSGSVGAWVEFRGEWAEGAPCGVAMATYANGAEYSGSWAPQGLGKSQDLSQASLTVGDALTAEMDLSDGNGAAAVATAGGSGEGGEMSRSRVGSGASSLRWVAAQAIVGASRSLPEGEGTWHCHSWPSPRAPIPAHQQQQRQGGSSGSHTSQRSSQNAQCSSNSISHNDYGSNCNKSSDRGKCSVVFRGQWVGGAAHGDGVWTVTYPYCDRRGPSRSSNARGGGGGGNERGAQWRCEEREGRWRRGYPVPGGDWRLQWSELQDNLKEVATASNDHSVHARHRALGLSGQFVGWLGSDGRPGNGYGMCKYPGGGVYTGPWLKGTRHGAQGCFVWPDGTSFEGNWANDKAACHQASEGDHNSGNNGTTTPGSGVLRMPDGCEHVFGNEASELM